ncbi:MAG: glucose-1-phosphate cytidylyltransferase [Pseudomonadota bacterium]
MKVVILAGGFGTRISEESAIRPKPLVEIGGYPILWHIMKIYSTYGLNDFVICCGYKGHLIKQFFRDYQLHRSDVTFDVHEGVATTHRNGVEPWRVTLVDTGDGTMTGGRLRRVRPHLGDETFCLTYGDGVADIDIDELISFHRRSQALVTVTAVRPPGRFGVLRIDPDGDRVLGFREKSNEDSDFINGGFFVVEPQAIDYIDGDSAVWEREPLEAMVAEGQVAAYRHGGFWQNMDTLRDKHVLEDLWNSGSAQWKTW